jgi:phosphoglycolate phosphatase-like HAD superfamily hydrolase
MPSPANASARPAVRHVVWDWNGTLIDDWDSCLAATAETLGLTVPSLIRGRRFFRPVRAYYSALLTRDLTEREFESLCQRWENAYRRHRSRECARPHARDAIALIEAQGITQSVLSMWRNDRIREDTVDHGLLKFFVLVQGSQADAPTKSGMLAAHLAQLGLVGSEVTLIGDSEDDFLAASSVGARFVHFRSAYEEESFVPPKGVVSTTNLIEAAEASW